MENLLERFKEFVAAEQLFSVGDGLLLAVSGGVDSVVLCDLCHQSNYDFLIAHCNFQLRGEESERDELFVRKLAEKYGKKVLVKKFDTTQYAEEHKLSIQEAARELRYGWFAEILHRKPSNVNDDNSTHHSSHITHLLTAHHKDDNIETLLMNFLRGTGIEGLHGILPKQKHIVRPLLFASREEILAYAKKNGLDWVEDSSNESSKYTRNYIRNELLPQLSNIYPQVRQNLAANMERFKEIEELYHQSVAIHKKKLVEQKGSEFHIPVLKLKKTSPLKTIVYEIVKEFGFSPDQLEDIIQLLEADTGKFVASSSHRIIKNRSWIIIAEKEPAEPGHILIEEPADFPFSVSGFRFSVSSLSDQLSSDSNMACLDAGLIHFPLILRRWKTGDYFYPLGMKKKKKLSRFFIDQKLSKTEKEKVWVLEMDKKIIWVAGYRIDDRFKVTPSSKKVLTITMKVS